MNRPWLIWSALAACFILILGMMGWMTHRSLHAEQERLDAQVESDYNERLRLSLSRMETIGANLVVQENQRPPLHYQAFFSPDDVYTAGFQNLAPQTVLQPSPLLSLQDDFVHLHFEFRREDGYFQSPQVPSGANRDLALSSGVADSALTRAANDFTHLGEILSLQVKSDLAQVALRCQVAFDVDREIIQAPIGNDNVWSAPGQIENDISYNAASIKRRSKGVNKAVVRANRIAQQLNGKEKKKDDPLQQVFKTELSKKPSVVVPSEAVYDQLIALTPFETAWIENELFLIREVTGSLATKYQGLWLNQKTLHAELSAEIPPELKGTQIAPFHKGDDDSYALVSLPWKLVPGEIPAAQIPLLSPMRKTILVAWVGAFIALMAMIFLLRGVMKLSERRAAFVSSVTHELRTPLTTFRLYSEMLAEGMVPTEEKKREYLRTMQGESERLNHLVENVLAYSQVERGTARSKFEKLAVADLVERLRPVLQRRVDQENATLSIEIESDTGEVETDVTAVEQIIFNLIDNACKYGLQDDGTGKIFLKVHRNKKGLIFEVSDEGKGVKLGEQKRLFRAFHKSAREAAHSKPGVGLGLALSRRLAKALGGNLTLTRPKKGASFHLILP